MNTDLDITADFPDNTLSSSSLTLLSNSDEIEQKIWEVVKQIPGINVGYGSIRLIIYISKGNKDESWKSAVGVAKGLVQTAAITGSVFVAPIVAPIAAGALTGVVSESINGVGHLIVFIIENSDALLAKDTPDHKEQLIYKEIKGIPAIGSAYSVARTPVYILKGNKDEAKISGINSIFDSATTAATCGIGTLTMLDKQTQKLIQKASKSIIQLVSRKVLEKVAAKEMTLVEGLEVVESVQAKCETLAASGSVESDGGQPNEELVTSEIANITELQPKNYGKDMNTDNDSLKSKTDSESQIEAKPMKRVRSTLEKFLMLKCTKCKSKSKGNLPKIKSDLIADVVTDFTIESDQDQTSLTNSPTVLLSEDSDPIIIVI